MRKLVSGRSIVLLTLILFVSGSKAARTGPLEGMLDTTPAVEPAPGTLRLLTWNVAHGRAEAFHQALLSRDAVEQNLAQIAEVVRHERPDLVALQEADGPSAWSGNFNHVSTLAQESGLAFSYRGDHNPFGLPDYDLSSGTALVSRLPLEQPLSTAFAVNWRDTKGFVVATVEVPGTGREVDVVSVHLDFLSPAERNQQILELAAALQGRSRPLVVLGDMNCEAEGAAETFSLFREHLGVHPYRPELEEPTFPSGSPARRLDWILISNQLEFTGYHTLQARLSDHLGVVAEVRFTG
jgi:endonuclease/exonuclease/phosphatase family metal-dependent hydrolase